MEPLFSQPMSVVEPGDETKSEEATLFSNALVGNLTNTSASYPVAADIYAAIERQCGILAKPVDITLFPPDFVIIFATPKQKQFVHQHGVLTGPGFKMLLIPWNGGYRCQVLTWDTAITVDATGLPPYAWRRNTIASILSKYCHVRTFIFYRKMGVCRVHGLAAGPEAVPPYDTLGIPACEPGVVYMRTYSLAMKAYLYGSAPNYESEDESIDSSLGTIPGSPAPYDDTVTITHPAEQFDVDPDALRDAYEEQNREEDATFMSQAFPGPSIAPFSFSDCLRDEECILGLQRERCPDERVGSDLAWNY